MSQATEFYAALGQMISAGAAVVALGLVSWQVRRANKASDFNALRSFINDANKHERAYRDSPPETKNWVFNELLNFLEIHAAALSRNVFEATSQEIVNDKLLDVVATLKRAEHLHGDIQKAVSSEKSLSFLLAFMVRNRKQIDTRVAALQQITEPREPPPPQ